VLTYPNPFNSASQRATFAYQITAAASIEIRIYNLARQFLRSLQSTKSMGYHNSDTWDGADSSGASLPNGTYYYVITATSTAGEVDRARGHIILLR
jgi:flagellar hook assembly protein FlgD